GPRRPRRRAAWPRREPPRPVPRVERAAAGMKSDEVAGNLVCKIYNLLYSRKDAGGTGGAQRGFSSACVREEPPSRLSRGGLDPRRPDRTRQVPPTLR